MTETAKKNHLEEHYNPHEHREVKRPISNFEALNLQIKGALGTGILASALVYKDGWFTGILFTIFMSFLITYCMHILIRNQYKICKRLKIPSLTYSDTVRKSLEFYGPRGVKGFYKYTPFIVDTLLLSSQFAVCSIYAQFILQTFGFFEQFTEFKIGLERYVYCIILTIPLFFIVFMGNWKIAAKFSLLGNVLALFSFGILSCYLLVNRLELSELTLTGKFFQIPKHFGMILFSLECITVISAFEGSLEKPQKFAGKYGVLNVGMLFVTFLYIFVGFFGYFRFGENVVGSFVNDLPLTEPASIICRSCYTISIYISFGFHGFILVDILWKKQSRGHDLKFKHFFRLAFVIVSTVIITIVPFVIRALILEIIYAITLPTLGIILPAVVEFCVEWPTHNENRNIVLWKDVLLILVGSIYSIIGLTFCINQFIQFMELRDWIFW